ncbi:MAG: hypothetical protein C3F11_02200 [Methylocystaceae bacterium]|nr:MAG: hypothetical protein C3F11_02200 [Methylocystaceae bacterium]
MIFVHSCARSYDGAHRPPLAETAMIARTRPEIFSLARGAGSDDGNTYEHDAIFPQKLRSVERSSRKKNTERILSKAEAKFLFEDGCDLLIVGAGQEGNARLRFKYGPPKAAFCKYSFSALR